MDIVLFGIQGSGKGTQGKILAEKFNLKIFETGAELRKLAQKKSTLGLKIKKLTEKGILVPNQVVMEIVENFIKSIKKTDKVLFDGIPRKKIQMQTFNKLMKKLKRDFIGINIQLSKKDAINRLTKRRICSLCKEVYPADYKKPHCKKCKGKLITRTDDNIESIKKRLEMFENETIPVLKAYQKQKKLITINGAQSIEKVAKELVKVMQGLGVKDGSEF